MTLTPGRALAILSLLVAIPLVGVGVGIAELGFDHGTRAWVGAALGAIGGVAICVGLFLYSVFRPGTDQGMGRGQWLIIAATASTPLLLSALSSTWEAALLGLLFGFLLSFIVGFAALMALRIAAERQDH
jgi:hypothetical protein